MISQEIHVGTQNKLIPYDIKVGMVLTEILFEGAVKAGKPVARIGIHEMSSRMAERNRKIIDLRSRRNIESLRKAA